MFRMLGRVWGETSSCATPIGCCHYREKKRQPPGLLLNTKNEIGALQTLFHSFSQDSHETVVTTLFYWWEDWVLGVLAICLGMLNIAVISATSLCVKYSHAFSPTPGPSPLHLDKAVWALGRESGDGNSNPTHAHDVGDSGLQSPHLKTWECKSQVDAL